MPQLYSCKARAIYLRCDMFALQTRTEKYIRYFVPCHINSQVNLRYIAYAMRYILLRKMFRGSFASEHYKLSRTTNLINWLKKYIKYEIIKLLAVLPLCLREGDRLSLTLYINEVKSEPRFLSFIPNLTDGGELPTRSVLNRKIQR